MVIFGTTDCLFQVQKIHKGKCLDELSHHLSITQDIGSKGEHGEGNEDKHLKS